MEKPENIFRSRNLTDFQNEVNERFLQVERTRHKLAMENHKEETKRNIASFDSHIDNKINTIAIIFAAVVLFSNDNQISLTLIVSICCMLFAIIFGYWVRDLSISSRISMRQKLYAEEIESHWKRSEELGDTNVEFLRQTMGDHISKLKNQSTSNPVLESLNLNADDIVEFFNLSFFAALIFLLIELTLKIFS